MTENGHHQINWRSRIVKRGTIKASEITPHPNNPRKHPQLQRDAVEASFDELGQIAPIIVNINNGYLVDGEERSWLALAQAGDVDVECDWVDLTEEEHLKALAYFDATGDLAVYDAAQLDALLQSVNSDNAAIQEMLAGLAESARLYGDILDVGEGITAEIAHSTLSERFIVPPFSVLDARQGYWQERKRAWLALGLQSELGRGGANPGGSLRPAATLVDGHTVRGDGKGRTLGAIAPNQATGVSPDYAKRIQGKLPAAIGGQPLPLDRMKNGKSPARKFGQDLMRGEGGFGSNGKLLAATYGASGKTDEVSRKNLAANPKGGAVAIRDHEWQQRVLGHVQAHEGGSGTSIFDPVLCELAYRWFSPPDGAILDPFAGGSVRGIVAHKLGRAYTGIDLRPEQVAANEEQAAVICQTVALPETITIKISAKSARLLFNGCDPTYIKNVCHASCCQSSTSPTGTMITIHPSEIPIIEARGGMVKAGLLQPRPGEKRCPFKTEDELCGLHFTPDKPFGCIASPFTLNNNNTLIVRNRYRLLKCFNDGKKIPAYIAFRASLDLIFGKNEAQRIHDHLEGGGGDITAMMSRTNYLMLKENDDIKHGRAMGEIAPPRWITGDSRNLDALLPTEQFDYIFSCPPYFDLEIYSDDKGDLSNAGDYVAFLADYRAIIAASVQRLKDNRFACFVVGDMRDKKGMYRNFVSDTISAFQDAGAKLYNEAILVTSVGSLPIRVSKQFESGRKLGKTHQNVLVFIKGDPRKAVEACGDVEAFWPESDSPDEIGAGGNA